MSVILFQISANGLQIPDIKRTNSILWRCQ